MMRSRRRWAQLSPLALLLGSAGMALAQAKAQEQTTAAALFEKHGLLGTWADHCQNRASPTNNYTVYRALDDGRVQFDNMDGPARRVSVGVVESAVQVGPQDVQLTRVMQRNGREFRVVLTIHVEGDRRRTLEWAEAGQTRIAAGRFLNIKENGANRGKPLPWVYKCD